MRDKTGIVRLSPFERIQQADAAYEEAGRATVKAFNEAEERLAEVAAEETAAANQYTSEIQAAMAYGIVILSLRKHHRLEKLASTHGVNESRDLDDRQSVWSERHKDPQWIELLRGHTVSEADGLAVSVPLRIPEAGAMKFDPSVPLPEPMIGFTFENQQVRIPVSDVRWTPLESPS